MALITSSIIQMYYLTDYWAGFIANQIIFFLQIYSHYLMNFRYFLNEYYMCAILHYMSDDSVKNSKRMTMQKWSVYHRNRDVLILLY